AVLAAFENARTEQFSIWSTAPPRYGTEPRGVQLPARSTTGIARGWSSLLWIAGVAAGLLIAAGIVRAIIKKSPPALGVPTAVSAPAELVPPAPELRPAPLLAASSEDNATPSEPAAADIEAQTRAPAGKSAPRTVRSHAPAQPRAAAATPRKPCG